MKIKSFLLILFLGIEFFSFADDINFSISVDKRKVNMGDAVYLNLVFEGTQEIGAPDLGTIEGFSSQYVGPSSKMTIVNGKTSAAITHIYVLVPMKVGTFQVGPFSVNYKGAKYTCESIEIEVLKDVSSLPSGEESQNGDLEDRIFLAIEPSKTKVYLNEIFDVKVKLYAYNLGVEDIYYPQICHNGFSLQEITKPIRYRDIVGSRTFDVMEFNTQASPLQKGQLSLGPASLKCDILMKQKKKRRGFFNDFDSFFSDFFSEYSRQPLTLNSPQIPITVLPLPQENRPASFDGAVGQFTFDVEAHPKQLNVGDPVTLRLIVGGEGNFGTVKFEALQFDSRDFKVYEPQVNVEKKTKIFESVLIPLKADVEYIPMIKFSFFDPQTSSYHTIEKGPFKIEVKQLAKKEDVKIVELSESLRPDVIKSQELGRDVIYIKDSIGKLHPQDKSLYKNKLFLFLQFLPLICFFVTLKTYRHFHKIKTDEAYARKLRAPKIARKGLKEADAFLKKADSHKFYEVIFKTLQRYLGYKLHMPWAGITLDIVNSLGAKNIEADVRDKITTIMSDCDLARYAPSGFNEEKMRQTLEQLRLILDYLERKLR